MHSHLWCWVVALAALPAAAQPAAPISKPAAAMSKPAGESAERAPGTYVSVFADYRPWQEPERVPWRVVNDDAGALGGHMGHVRGHAERMQAAPPPAKPEAKR